MKADRLYEPSREIRDNLTFHCDAARGKKSGKLIRRAIERRSSSSDGKRSYVMRGDTAFRWHFKVADDIVEPIVVREIWQIEGTEGVQGLANSKVDDIRDVFDRFVDFAGEFIWRCCEQ